jgi:hypothetical protein
MMVNVGKPFFERLLHPEEISDDLLIRLTQLRFSRA